MAKLPKKETTDQPISTDIGMVFRYLFEAAENVRSPKDATLNHTPVVDMFSTSDSIIVEIELPGVRQEEVDISILRNTLTIKALKYECFEERKINFVCIERCFGKLFRVVDIPCPVDTTNVKATFYNGLLTITLPKIAEKRGTPKKISVES